MPPRPRRGALRVWFENRLVDLIAAELDTTVEYTWWASRRGFVRNTLNAGACGIVTNVVGYSVLGDYGTDSPPSRIVTAVAAGEVDVAIAWGAMAGYFAARQAPTVRVTPVPGTGSRLPMTFDVAIGVRKPTRRGPGSWTRSCNAAPRTSPAFSTTTASSASRMKGKRWGD